MAPNTRLWLRVAQTGHFALLQIVEVYTKAAVRVDPAIGEAGDVDTAMLILTHEDGTLTYIDNSRQAVYGYDQRVEVFGSAGMAASENPREHTAEVHTAAGAPPQKNSDFFFQRFISRFLPGGAGLFGGLGSGKMAVWVDDGRGAPEWEKATL